MKASQRDQQKQQTRALIKETARKLITECGYEKTTMRALAEAAGVGVGTIALHFQDKRTLLLSTFYDEIGAVSLEAVESVPADAPLKEQFLYILHGLYRYYAQHALFLRSVVKEALFATGEWRDKYAAQFEAVLVLVAALVDAAKERGEAMSDVDSRGLAHVCWCLHVDTLINGLTDDTFDPDAMVARLEPMMDVVLRGVLIGRA